MVELATVTPLVGHGSSAAAVVVVLGAGAVVVVVGVVTTGLVLGVAEEQAASRSAAPRRTDAVLREDPGCGRSLGNRTCGTRACWHVGSPRPGTVVGPARRTS
jgi:hypothetical protein